MASLNKVFLMGNLTREPELRYTPGSNFAVCEFGLAVNRRFMQANGQEKDETCFLDIVVWGKQAETCQRYLQKGSSVFIEGRLLYDQWVEQATQKKRSRIRITAERVQFLSSTRRDDGGMPAEAAGPMEDPTRQGYASPRPAYQPQQNRGGAPRQGGYQRQQYNDPPQQQIYRGGNGGNAPMPEDQSSAPAQEPPMPEGDPFENVDDIPF